MDKKQLNDMIELVSYEKAMDKKIVRQAMESAIASLARKEHKSPEGIFNAVIDAKTGDLEVFRLYRVVEEFETPDAEIRASDFPDYPEGHLSQDGAYFIIPIAAPAWSRQGLQVVKQVLAQKMKQGLRQTVAEAWADRVGEVVLGQVKRIEKDRIIIDLGEPAEGVLAGKDKIFRERFKIGQRVRAIVSKVDALGAGGVITLSRSSDEFLKELIAIEVPDVGYGTIVIKAVAREPGVRAKIAVMSNSAGLKGPTYICAGSRGVRAQAVSNELNGERIEFLEWTPDPAQFILAALEPAQVKNLVLDEGENRAYVGVEETNLAKAIGARGQNVRLASKLTGVQISVMSVNELGEKRALEDATAAQELMELLEIDQEMADLLVAEGFTSIESIALCGEDELFAVPGFDEDLVTELRARARDTLSLKQMWAQAADLADSLEGLEGLGGEDVQRLNAQGVHSLQDLAEQATFDLEWPEADTERLGQWIIQAREKIGMI